MPAKGYGNLVVKEDTKKLLDKYMAEHGITASVLLKMIMDVLEENLSLKPERLVQGVEYAVTRDVIKESILEQILVRELYYPLRVQVYAIEAMYKPLPKVKPVLVQEFTNAIQGAIDTIRKTCEKQFWDTYVNYFERATEVWNDIKNLTSKQPDPQYVILTEVIRRVEKIEFGYDRLKELFPDDHEIQRLVTALRPYIETMKESASALKKIA